MAASLLALFDSSTSSIFFGVILFESTSPFSHPLDLSLGVKTFAATGATARHATFLQDNVFYVYILQSQKDSERYYIGIFEDVDIRVRQHNEGKSRWTKGKGPWGLAWTSQVMSLSDARKLVNNLKRQGRGSGFYSITGLARPPGS